MRIIITTIGEKERQDLENTSQASRGQSILIPLLNKSNSTKKIGYSSILFKSSRKMLQSTQLFDKDKSNISNKELLHAKHIKINQSPITTNLINSFSEKKYEEGIKMLKNKLKPNADQNSRNMPDFSMKTNTQITPNQNIPIKDIINNEAFMKMIVKFRNEQIVEDNNYIMQEKDYRKNARSIQNNFNLNINTVLSKQINKNRADFIKYITNKRDLTPIFLRNLSQVDESKVYDLNRICQIINSNRSQNDLLKEKLKEKALTRESILIKDTNKSLNKIKSEIKMRKTLINGYTKKLIKTPMIDYCYYERTKRYWNRYNVYTLQRKNNSIFNRMNNNQFDV